MTLSALKISQLKKTYSNKVTALSGLDLEIADGEFFGLLGPNGAGKSSLINCTVGLSQITSGSIEVYGQSVVSSYMATRQMIGFAPQEPNVDRFFNLARNLQFQGGFFGLSHKESKKRAQELLAQFNLSEKAKEQFYKLSGGMQKRLIVARALMNQPKLLILDEPTAGVDVSQRHELWKLLRELNQNGTTILLTTHYIDEAEELCGRIGIINHGKLIELGQPKDLIEKYCEGQIKIIFNEDLDPKEFTAFDDIEVEKNQVRGRGARVGLLAEKILAQALKKEGRRVIDIKVKEGDLEEVFIKVAGCSLSDGETD